MIANVTPCAGVWIEITSYTLRAQSAASLPVRECGLKSIPTSAQFLNFWSLPVRECGLKFFHAGLPAAIVVSLPVRECGLKFAYRLI